MASPPQKQKGPRFSPGPLHLPRLRGEHLVRPCLDQSSPRITPARAGTTGTRPETTWSTRDHSRVGGDNTTQTTHSVILGAVGLIFCAGIDLDGSEKTEFFTVQVGQEVDRHRGQPVGRTRPNFRHPMGTPSGDRTMPSG
jgi:hypothetical protein